MIGQHKSQRRPGSVSDNDADIAFVTAGVAASDAWADALAALEPWLLERQIELTAVPAPTHFEALRAEWFRRAWGELGLEAAIDAAGNVLALRPGRDPEAPLIALSAHLDTAFAPGTPVRPERREGRIWAPGISDNGAGLAALLALARILRDHAIPTRSGLLFVANVGEEGEGDLKGMRHLFGPESRVAPRIGCTLVLDGPGCDQITTQALPSRRFKLLVTGPGGHSWSDLCRASALHAAIRIAAAFLAQVQPQAQVLGANIGLMQGGSAVNAIAADAQLKLDLRACDAAGIELLAAALQRALASGLEQENAAALGGAVRARLEPIGERPGGELPASAPLLHMVRAVDGHLGIAAQIQRASTDANIPLSLRRPALRLGAGGSGGGIHTLQEWFDPTGRTLALRRILGVTLLAANA
ncbi:MAG: M20/M25/M40 family metallo-hydrolase, partial [Terriglobales bacterium]